ncbi:MAG: phosphoglucosamine mutase [Methanobacteriota archaeon]|nr:MAG: phosphoglucosamine mutase [Euryarchaeota archaeon]
MGKLFGTFGVRGVVGKEITPEFCLKMGMSFGSFLGCGKKVVIGSDTRVSGEMVKNAVVSGLMSTGVDVIDIGVAPTPVVQFATRHLGADGGVVVTASHNPPEYNGIKLLEASGMGLTRENEEKVENNYFENRFSLVGWDRVGCLSQRSVLPTYVARVKEHLDVEKIRERQPFVVVDPGNGTGSHILPQILREVGCRVMTINAQPDGFFPGRPSEPTPQNLVNLCRIVSEVGADLGVALDGDADRAVAIDENGSYVQGDRTFGLIVDHLLGQLGGGVVVTTVATSHIIDEIALRHGGRVIKTAVGDLVVSRKLVEVGGVVGGEENGGVIFPSLVLGRDGVLTAAKLVEILSVRGKSFSRVVGELPRTYQFKEKIFCPEEKKGEVMRFVSDKANSFGELVTIDGVKVLKGEWEWYIIRASGTEPIIRCFSEAKSEKRARELLEEGVSLVKSVLESL